jgi:energy-converting hydrogenase Eha subunit A
VDARPRILALLVGLLPFAAAISYFKLVYGPGNDLVAGQGLSQSLERLSDLGRHQLVVRTSGRQLAPIAGPVVALVLSYTLLRGSWPARKDWQCGTGAATALSVLLATMVGYYLVYVLTPKDLAWHLSTSLTRLMMQLWPSLLFLMFMAASPARRSDGLAT